MMSRLYYKITAAFLFLGSSIALLGAFISQYLFDMPPCVLCIYQRIPYAVVILLSSIILVILRKKNTLSKNIITSLNLLLLLCITALLADAAIAFFHVGVEHKWWEGTSKCAGATANSIDALRAALYNAPTVRCDEPQFQFIFTMAGWNVIYALGLCICTVFLFIKGQRCAVSGL